MPANKRTLVLNANFIPLGVISWKRAIALSCLNKEDASKGLEIIDYYDNDYIIAAHGRRYPVPAVVRSPIYIKHKKNGVPFSRKNVFIRDQMICQYCGKKFPPEELTYDHVIPRSKWKGPGTPTCFENIVTSCIKCNRFKANRTPKEANMKLLREPKKPSLNNYVLGLSPWSTVPEKWDIYLPQLFKEVLKSTNSEK
jgi:hypothetical protein